MTMKAHTYYIIFGRPPIGGEAYTAYNLISALLSAQHSSYLFSYLLDRRIIRNTNHSVLFLLTFRRFQIQPLCFSPQLALGH